MGYEEYINPVKALEALAEIQKEESVAQKAYLKNKEKENRKNR